MIMADLLQNVAPLLLLSLKMVSGRAFAHELRSYKSCMPDLKGQKLGEVPACFNSSMADLLQNVAPLLLLSLKPLSGRAFALLEGLTTAAAEPGRCLEGILLGRSATECGTAAAAEPSPSLTSATQQQSDAPYYCLFSWGKHAHIRF